MNRIPAGFAVFEFRLNPVEILVFVLLLFCSVPLYGQASSESNRLLILHDSTDLGIWRDQFDAAFRDYVSENSSPDTPLRVSVQYSGMNLYTDEVPTSLITLLQDQHRIDPASLVIAVLPNSIQFMEEYGDLIYPDIPRLYVIPDRAQTETIVRDANNVVLTNENAAMAVNNTLRLIGRLNPGLTDIYIFSGVDNYGPFQRQQVSDGLDEILPNINAHFFSGIPMGSLVSALGSVPEQSAGYLLSYEVDTLGNMFTTLDVLQELTENTELPIFGSFDSLFGNGIVGGNMDFASTRGADAARVAVDLVNGRNTSGSDSAAQNIFDARMLDRYGFDRSLLPPGSTIEFETFSLWDEYRPQLIGAIILVAIQSALIALLLLSLRRRRTAEQKSALHVRELAIQKNLFESVINSIPDAILITHADRTIYAANKSSTNVFGLDVDQLIGKSMMSLIDFRDEEEHAAEQAMFDDKKNNLRPLILNFKRVDGSKFAGETLGTKIISSDGEVLGYFSLVRDVTRRLHDEKQQQQSQKMEALGNLVGGIAHDFNNVLGVITAYAEINSLTETSVQSKSNLDKIVSATKRGAELCHQILAFSKDMSVEQSMVDCAHIVTETFELLRASVPGRIKLELETQGEDFSIQANSTQLQQVILNLATNASHAIGENEGGLIKIGLYQRDVTEAASVSDGILEPGSYVLLKISDNGCGISENDIRQVFEPFYTTRAGEGTGIGLAIVYKIVRSHGGVMNLHSVEGEGTEFEIYFKSHQGVAVEAEANRGEELVCGSGEKILLVDDEEELLESLTQLLSTIGYSVTAFTDSSEALQYFRDHPDAIDLLISDQVMPGLEGTRLLQSIREVRQDLPAIICTGHSELLEGKIEQDIHIDSVLKKPFTASEVSRNIGSILGARAKDRGAANTVSLS